MESMDECARVRRVYSMSCVGASIFQSFSIDEKDWEPRTQKNHSICDLQDRRHGLLNLGSEGKRTFSKASVGKYVVIVGDLVDHVGKWVLVDPYLSAL